METPGASSTTLRFGVFEADLHTGELRKAGRKVALQEQPFKVLATLLARPGEMVTREELRERLWPADTFVDFDTGLNKAVRKIREVLGDSADFPRFVETLPRRGYRFIAPVESVDIASAPQVAPVSPPTTPRHRQRWLVPATATVIVLAAATIWGWRTTRHSKPEFGSIAVLPLENLSGDPSQEFFADGITDELITELAKIGSLRVISRTSVMQYRGSRKALPRIAAELGVSAIVEGSVVRAGNRVRVTAQLINASTDRHLWAKSYQQELKDILALQAQVAQDIAAQVNAKLTDQERRSLTQPKAVPVEAHEAYLKGHLLLHDNPEESALYFRRAIELYPNYADAYAGLADAFFWPAWDWETVPPAPAFSNGKQAALKALELDPANSDGHAALAWEKLFFEWKWGEAENEIREAIRLNPNNAWAHHHYARLLAVTGRFDESIRECRRVLELDPMDFKSGGNLAWMLYLARRYDESIRECHRMMEKHPSIPGFHGFLASNYQAKGRFKEAIEECHFLEPWSSTGGIVELAFLYGVSGDQPAARAAIDKLLTISKQKYIPPYAIGVAHVGLRDNNCAFEWFEKAFAERSPSLIYLKTEPKLDAIRSDRRYSDLVRRMAFPAP